MSYFLAETPEHPYEQWSLEEMKAACILRHVEYLDALKQNLEIAQASYGTKGSYEDAILISLLRQADKAESLDKAENGEEQEPPATTELMPTSPRPDLVAEAERVLSKKIPTKWSRQKIFDAIQAKLESAGNSGEGTGAKTSAPAGKPCQFDPDFECKSLQCFDICGHHPKPETANFDAEYDRTLARARAIAGITEEDIAAVVALAEPKDRLLVFEYVAAIQRLQSQNRALEQALGGAKRLRQRELAKRLVKLMVKANIDSDEFGVPFEESEIVPLLDELRAAGEIE